MHNLDHLTHGLKERGLEVAIETSGAHPLTGTWDWICFSPKKFKKPLSEFYGIADELKVVVYNTHDFEWAETFAREMNGSCKLYLQPEWDKRDEMLPLIVQYIRDNPKWKISLQTHKYIGIA